MGGARDPYHSSGRHRRVPHLCTRQSKCTGARGQGRGWRRGGGAGAFARSHLHRRRHVQVHTRAHSLSIQSVWGGARLQVLNVASRRTRTRKVIRIWRRFRKAPSTLCICACLPNSPYAHAYIAHICIYMHIIFILHILSCSRSKRNQRSTGLKSRRSGTAVERSVVGLDSDDESDGTSTLQEWAQADKEWPTLHQEKWGECEVLN